MLPEGELVGVGQTHWFEDQFFGLASIASDRRYRETFNHALKVTTRAVALEEIAQGSTEEVKTWGLGDEAFLDVSGPEAKISTTKAFKPVGREEEEESGVEPWVGIGLVEEEGEVGGGGAELMEEAIAKFLQETKWEPRSFTPSSIYSGPAEETYYDGELWLTARSVE
jgi:hypothetical protein